MTTRRRGGIDDVGAVLAQYVPRLLADHDPGSTGREALMYAGGTLVSADISGFTALSERLAAFGHEGAEELTDLLNRCFATMIDVCERRCGDVVKFGGDALLVLFSGAEHAIDAAVAMCEMHEIVSRTWSTDSVRQVRLGISQGAHSGTIGASLVDVGHLELIVGGPVVSKTVRCEADAARGEILVSAEAGANLPQSWLGPQNVSGAYRLRRKRVFADAPQVDAPVEPVRVTSGIEQYLPRALAEQIAAGVPGEHRQVVVAFVNLMGTDDLFADAGAAAVHEAVQAFAGNVRIVLDRHPIHLLASDAYPNGTKLILTAGAPSSTDADEDHLLLALHELFELDSPLPIRAGVNRGHVFVGDLGGPTRRTYTVMGDAVNLAARLMQRAEAGQVITTLNVLARAETSFGVRPLAPFKVKGKSKPIRATVLGSPSTRDEGVRASQVDFVGRLDERAVLGELLASAIGGSGRVAHIVGDTGIGKSRLVQEALTDSGVSVRRLSGGYYARHNPFLTVRRLVRELLELDGDDPVDLGEQLVTWTAARVPALLPWLPLIAIPVGAQVGMTSVVDRLAQQFRRDRLLMVTADLIDAALNGPVVLVADDINLLDNGSIDVVRNLAARAANRPWFIVATGPPDDDAIVPTAIKLHLGPLARSETTQLAAAAGAARTPTDTITPADLEVVAARSNGNPLFILELVEAIGEHDIDAIPESVESLITTRIDRMSPADRALLREVAVGGIRVEAELLAEALNRPELRNRTRWAALDPFLMQNRPGWYEFRQTIYRDVAYEGLAYRRRRETHLAIGTSLERRPVDDLAAIAPLLSDHFGRAREHERAWRYSVIAADGARRSFANSEAVMLLERALRHAADARSADDAAKCRVAENLGDVYVLMGRHPEAVAAFHRSRSWHTEPEQHARLLRKIGYVRLREGKLSQSLAWFTRAQQSAARIANVRTRLLETAEIELERAGTLHRQGRMRECAKWAETAAETAEATGDRLTMARAFNMVEVAYRTLGRDDSERYSDLALEMYAGIGDLVGEANVLNNRGVRLHFDGRWREAIEAYDRSRALREQAGDVVGEAMAANNVGEVLSLQGRYGEALALFAHATASWRTAGYSVGVGYALSNIALTNARSGDPDRGVDLLDEATAMLSELGASALVNEISVGRVEMLLLSGEDAEALTLARQVRDRLSSVTGDQQALRNLRPLLGLAELRTGEIGAAASTLETAVGDATAAHDKYAEAVALWALAELERGSGRPWEAHQERACELFDELDVVQVPPVLEPRLT